MEVHVRLTSLMISHTGVPKSGAVAVRPSEIAVTVARLLAVRGAVPAFEAHPREHPCSGAMEQCIRFQWFCRGANGRAVRM